STTSGRCCRASCTASSPSLAAATTSTPTDSCSSITRPSRTTVWSSTTSTRTSWLLTASVATVAPENRSAADPLPALRLPAPRAHAYPPARIRRSSFRSSLAQHPPPPAPPHPPCIAHVLRPTSRARVCAHL